MAFKETTTESGLVIHEEAPMEKRDRMTRNEWRAYFSQEEISEDDYRDEYLAYKRPLDA